MNLGNLLFAQSSNVSWYILPLAMVVSLVYSACRFELPDRILRRAVWLFLQIVGFMAAEFPWEKLFGI